MQTQLQDLGPILIGFRNGIELGDGLPVHSQLSVTARGPHLPFKSHGPLPKQDAGPVLVAAAKKDYPGSNVSSSCSRFSKSRSVLSTGVGEVMSTPARRNVSSGNFEPPDFK